jgi:PTH1 family peptidyl-tRNA hydrolase
VLLVVGLGNPGSEHAGNRHNIGFRVAAAFREAAGLERFARREDCEVSRGRRRGRPIMICRPLGYMNRSGEAVARLARRERLGIEDLFVVVDDLYLPLGRLRVRQKGGDGGHNGLRSLLAELGDSGFARLRFGIGSPEPGKDMADWVLEDFNAAEERVVGPAIEKAVEVIDTVLTQGIERAMNRYNAADPEPGARIVEGGSGPDDSRGPSERRATG